MDSTHDDFSIPAGASYDRSFGADRHDLRSPLIEQEPAGLMGRATQAARRILRRTPEAANDGAALSRGAARGADANLRS